ncbi:MAG: MFS transporter [Chloroflexi bacterium]|jgi:MFS family permease|nr:MFS transporter [Anaerolineaceae bacterium]NMB90270.1 MFS transporter [Chloroflexota bacterium]
MEEKNAKRLGYMVIAASWLAVFCLFGFRSSFSILNPVMISSTGWDKTLPSTGYSIMMSVYAITAFFSGMIIDKHGTRPAYFLGAIFSALGFYLTSLVPNSAPILYLVLYGLFAGMGTGMLWVSSTVSVRKWFVGKAYATWWGVAFAGAPIAQVLLSLIVKPILTSPEAGADSWRIAMRILAVIVFVALMIAAAIAKKSPEAYNLKPFGLPPAGSGPVKEEYLWTPKTAFKTLPIWGTIAAFLTAMVGEFLIWTQVVRFWTVDASMDLATATNLYIFIGISGIFTMPLLGKVADVLVDKLGGETKARKVMLIFAPAVGAVACLVLLASGAGSFAIGIVACVLFAIYWAIEPGGCAGYAGSIYGRKSLGRIWGLATLVVMGIGPALGTYVGSALGAGGSYVPSVWFALGAFVISTVVALFLPLAATVPEEKEETIAQPIKA